jgi:hypothetical protein
VQYKSLFDDWVNNFVPEFKQANKLWSDMSDAKGIEDAAKIAGTRVGGGSSVDLRNAMATLRRGEIEGTVHHPPEVQAVIDSLTKKGAFDNLSRATRAGLGYGGGLGTLGTLAYGASTGNFLPAAVIGGATAMGLGTQAIANVNKQFGVNLASATARNGGPIVAEQVLPDNIKALIAALVAKGLTPQGQQPQ